MLLVMSALLVGCHTDKYGVYLKNLTPVELKDIHIVFPEHTFHATELIADQGYPFHFASYPVEGRIPRKGTIKFSTPDKSVHSIDFAVPPLRTKTSDGDFYCFIKIHSSTEVSVEEWRQDHLLSPSAAQELNKIANEPR